MTRWILERDADVTLWMSDRVRMWISCGCAKSALANSLDVPPNLLSTQTLGQFYLRNQAGLSISAEINDIYVRRNSRLFNSKQSSLQRLPCPRSVSMPSPPSSNLCSSSRAPHPTGCRAEHHLHAGVEGFLARVTRPGVPDCVTAETVSLLRPCACSTPLSPALSTRSSVHPTLDPARALSVPFSARTRLRLRHEVACVRSLVPSSSRRSPQAHARRLLSSLKSLCR